MFIVAAITILATIPSSSAFFFKKKVHAHIVNQLSPNPDDPDLELLYVHCKCTDHDMEDRFISIGSEFEWNFKEHGFLYTNWNCFLNIDYRRHVFYSAYYDQIPSKYLDKQKDIYNIYWFARDDGVYVRNFEKKIDHLYRRWEISN
ncbi:S-protein homolog 1 [Linum perenne]